MVARYLAHLVARLHKAAMEAGKTTHELPQAIQGLTQLAQDACDEASDSGAETDDETASNDSDADEE